MLQALTSRRNFSSFRMRLTLQWTVVFGAILIVSLTLIYFGVRRSLRHTLEADLRTLAGTEAASATDNALVHLHPFNEPAIINQRHREKFVQILTADGAVVNQSANLINRTPLISGGSLEAAMAGNAPMTNVSLNGTPGQSLSLSVVKGDKRYVVVVAVPLSEIQSLLHDLRIVLLLVGLLALAATGLIGFRLATIALRPVDLMTQRAQLIGHNHLLARLAETQTDDELGRLAQVLNAMLDRLYQMIESQQRFAGDVSHELRSPLTALRSRIEITLRRPRTTDEYRTALTKCLGEVERLTKLAEDLLELARCNAHINLDLSEVELQPLIESEIVRVRPEAEARGVTVETQMTTPMSVPMSVIIDEQRMRSVLHNLLSNAIQYSKPIGGRVLVTAAAVGEDVWITVQDEGIGLSQEQQQHVFDRFWRADEARSLRKDGVGLGLAICREIIRAHGGEMSVVSTPDQGSAFSLRLPLRFA